MKLWTASLDYFATGEGRAFMALIAYADTAEQAREGFARHFSGYYAEAARVSEGMVRNPVTELLFSPQALETVQNLSGEAAITLMGYFQFNRS